MTTINNVTASQIIARARSLSDLPNSQFVSYDDEVQSLNESWKDLYQSLLEQGDDDYFVNQITVGITPAMSVGTNEWEIPLPEDFYKLRYVDYRGATLWTEMDKFPLSMRDYNPMEPYYRLKNGKLWVIGSQALSTALTLRIAYFPPPVEITQPKPTLDYGTTLTATALAAVTQPFYIDAQQVMLYVSGNDIWAESLPKRQTVKLLTGVTPLRPTYYKGYLYYIQAANIFRGAMDPNNLAAVVGAAITVVGTVLSFSIFDDLIYFTTATSVFTCKLDGTSITLLSAIAVDDVCLLGYGANSVLIGRTTATNTVISLTSPAIATNVLHVAVDVTSSNRTSLFTIDTTLQVHRLDVSWIGTTVTVETDTIIHPEALYLGNGDNGYLSLIDEESQGVWAFGFDIDYDFTYPNSVATEIMAHQCAIDWRVKQNNDISGLLLRLGHRSGSDGPGTGLWGRFEQAAQRDQYKVTRIRQSYDRGGFLR